MKRIICIGGGEIKNKTTLEIDRYIATLAKDRAGDKRANGLFIGTASHDFMPLFNSFRKTYTSVFDIKVDCLLTVNVDTSKERIVEKFSKADFIYVVFVLREWPEKGIIGEIIKAYDRGVIIPGLSAGAVCWFEQMYTDSASLNNGDAGYKLYPGLGILKGTACPHFNERIDDFTSAVKLNNIPISYAIENNSAVEFVNGNFTKVITSGGKSYEISNKNGCINKKMLWFHKTFTQLFYN